MATAKQQDHTASNLAIWNQVEKTNPDFTKGFSRGGGFKGTAINPTYMAMKATEMFGPIGKGWGVEIQDETLMEGAPIFNGNGEAVGHELIHKLRVCLWYLADGQRCEIVQFGQTTFVGKNKYGPFTDEEAPKKSLTDGMTKCLSLLGFSADVHMGRYDDNKYVNDLRQEQNQAKQQDQGQQQQGQRKPPAKPEVPHIQVAQAEDGNPDWQTFTDALKAEINKAPDVATVNELVKVHNGAISNLKNVAPDLCKVLEETTKLRRSDLAQARTQQAAE